VAGNEGYAEDQVKRICALLYSALAALEEATGLDRKELGGDYYFGRRTDAYLRLTETWRRRSMRSSVITTTSDTTRA
jgi:hypothetical protein